MSSNINSVFLTGNLTRDAETHSLPSGADVISFTVAVNDRAKNQQSGEWEDRANFFDCTMFGNHGSLAEYMRKGSKVAVQGSLRWRQWEKDGQNHSKVEVIVREVELMQGRGDQQTTSPRTPQHVAARTTDPYSDEDIPF